MPFTLCNEEAIELLCETVDSCINNRITYLKLLKCEVSEEERKELEIKRQLFYKYYESEVEREHFNDGVYSIKTIVNNDFGNWCVVISPEDKDYEELKAISEKENTKENGFNLDISDYEFKSGQKYSYLEMEHEDYFLVRY